MCWKCTVILSTPPACRYICLLVLSQLLSSLLYALLYIFSFPMTPGEVEYTLGKIFCPTLSRGFCTFWDNSSFAASTEALSATPADTASEIRPLTSPPPLPELRGCLLRLPMPLLNQLQYREDVPSVHSSMHWKCTVILSTPPACRYSCLLELSQLSSLLYALLYVFNFPTTPVEVEYTPGKLFCPTLRRGFTSWDDSSFAASTEALSATPADTASEIRPLTSPPPTPKLGGIPVEAAYAPAEPTTVRRECTLCTLLHALEMYNKFVNSARLYI